MSGSLPKNLPLHEWTASEIAHAIRERKLTSLEVTRHFLERIHRLNSRINAIVALREEEALKEASAADLAIARGDALGPLHGVPVTIKDIHRMAGSPSTYGFPQYRRAIPNEDCWAVAQVRKAGAIILGRTNVPVGGFDWQCWNPIYGRSVNPWDVSRTCGGSSGGAAAAVAARLVPLDIGSDIAGSIRYPSHCCGVMGLRPTDGRVPNWRVGPPDLPTVFRHFLTSGPVARSLEDLELGLETLTPGGARFPEVPTRPLRIAWAEKLRGLEHVPLSEETRKIFRAWRESLAAQGHELIEAAPAGIDFAHSTEVWGEIAGFEFLAALPKPLHWLGARYLLSLGLTSVLYGKGALSRGFGRGLRASPRRYFESLTRRDELMMKMTEFSTQYDLWITPVAPTEAIQHHRFGRRFAVDGVSISYSDYLSGYLTGLGTLGHPILALPIGMTSGGMPIAVQVHGARNLDEKLLRDVRALRLECALNSAPAGFA